MRKPNRIESPFERRFNFGVLVVVRIAALVLGVLAVAGVTIKGIDIEQAFSMLMIAFVLLCLADLQDTFALNNVLRTLEGYYSAGLKNGNGQTDATETLVSTGTAGVADIADKPVENAEPKD